MRITTRLLTPVLAGLFSITAVGQELALPIQDGSVRLLHSFAIMLGDNLYGSARFFVLDSICMDPGLATPVQGQKPSYRAETDLVRIVATVSDASGQPVTTLTQKDFVVAEDGVPQHVALFARDVDTPLSIALVVDVSRSMADELAAVQRGLARYAATMADQDEIGLVTFDSRVTTVVNFSDSRDRLRMGLEELKPGGGTALYKGMVEGVRMVNGGRHRKRVILLVTDGNNSGHGTSRRSARRAVQASEALVYAVGIGHSNRNSTMGRIIASLNGPQMGLLGEFAENSGGRAELVDDLNGPSGDRFVETMSRFAAELRQQYTLGYYPPEKRGTKKIRQVRITTGTPGYVVRARTIYVGR